VAFLRAAAILAVFSMMDAAAQAETAKDPAFPEALAPQCWVLAARLKAGTPRFADLRPETVHGMLTWHASACERPPNGPGLVVQLCEGKAVDGATVFFWEKTEGGRRFSGFLSCG